VRRRPVRSAIAVVLASSVAACVAPTEHRPPLARPSPHGRTCSHRDVSGVRIVVVESEGDCLSGNLLVLFRCATGAHPILRVASETGPVSFLGGSYGVAVRTLPADVRFEGTGEGLEVLIADPLGVGSAGSPTPSPSPGSTPEPITEREPLVYVRHEGITERWLQLERKRALHRPPIAWLIGDSILDGGRDDVEAAFSDWDLTFDAQVGRPSSSGIELAQQAADAGADAVLIELGTNDQSGAVLRTNMTEILEVLRDVPLVVWQTVRGPADDALFPELNDVIREVAGGYPNVVVADWARFAPADAFMTDGIHPDRGFEHLEADLLQPLFSDWLDAMTSVGSSACAKRVVDATT
jgi:hypothetical protein